jgi:phosphoserine aminotransferase
MRVFNFSPGPATLPLPVLEQVRAELADWQGSGMSVMEVSHRGKAFTAVATEAEAALRRLLQIPTHYKVLFLQGGAAAQFAAVPLNLCSDTAVADYINTGTWSKKALTEAKRYCRVNVIADEAASNYSTVPEAGALRFSSDAAYVHYCPNETIGGVEFPYVPQTDSVPLVADMSSTILSRPIDVAKFGVIYAGAQKNIGPSGLCIVIVREDLLDRARAVTPAVLNYRNMAQEGSMLNTPATFSWYVAGLVFKWLEQQGGMTAVAAINQLKAEKLYRAIDESGYYRNPVAKNCRSWMNVPFLLPRTELEAPFLKQAVEAGLSNLAGHRSVGGLRASIYNAMPLAGVEALIAFMRDFQQRHA